MAKFLLSVILLATEISLSFGQGVALSGKVVDADEAPLAYVNVFVRGKSTGTVTNASGEFALRGLNASDTVTCSLLGYETKLFLANAAPAPLVVKMAEAAYELQAVEVLSASAIVRKAYANMFENFDTAPLSTTGIFRKQIVENSKYVFFGEANLKYCYRIVNSSILRYEVDLLGTKISENRMEDKGHIKVEFTLPPHDIMLPYPSMHLSNTDNFYWNLEKILTIEGRNIYQIRFKEKSRQDKKGKRVDGNEEGLIYITQDEFAIIATEQISKRPSQVHRKMLIVPARSLENIVVTKRSYFKEIDGKWQFYYGQVKFSVHATIGKQRKKDRLEYDYLAIGDFLMQTSEHKDDTVQKELDPYKDIFESAAIKKMPASDWDGFNAVLPDFSLK
jgi:hypothetical protein